MKNSKVVLNIIICMFLLFTTAIHYSYAAEDSMKSNDTVVPDILLYIDGLELPLHNAVISVNNNTLAPFRPIFESLGLGVTWDSKTKKITGETEGLKITLWLGQRKAYVNGQSYDLPIEPQAINGVTYVPIRFIGEATEREVKWNALNQRVTINDVHSNKLYYEDGSLLYEGGIVNGLMNGLGKLYTQYGDIWYEAVFTNDAIFGTGTMYFYSFDESSQQWAQTRIFIGEFEDGIPNGQGKFTDVNGTLMYEGQVKDGQPNGMGTYYNEGRKVYEGYWKDNQYHGKGMIYYADGTVWFDGEFKNNKRDGYGKLYSKEGRLTFEGYFKEGIPHGEGTFYFSNGSKFVGEFVNGQRSEGIQYDGDGDIKFEGEFERGHYYNGTMYYEDGSKYVGEFNGISPHGTGTLYDRDGNVIHQGEFADGEFIE